VVLVDGLADGIQEVLDACFGELGTAVSWIGCGAGTDDGRHAPCVFTSEGVFQDAAVVAMSAYGCSVGARHGWRELSSPLVANRTQGRVVHQLGWRPAFDVYREIVQARGSKSLDEAGFWEDAKLYPLGLIRGDREDVVRDPVAVEGSALRFVGDVPENSSVRILCGDRSELIEAARLAASTPRVPEGRVARASLVVDCVSRVGALEDDFREELEVVAKELETVAPGIEMDGVLSCGEIASPGHNHLELLNKTVVVGIFHDDP
jgi:hypothetical protein